MEHVYELVFIFGYATVVFLLTLVLAPAFIAFLKKHSFGKKIREETVDGRVATIFKKLHQAKEGTPTMGGILIWSTVAIVILLSTFTDYSVLDRGQVYLPLATLVATGLLGALDDYFNIRGWGAKKGLGVKPKMLWLTLFAAVGAWWFYSKLGYDSIHIPRLGDFVIGWWYIPLFIFVIIASANAVNITDGLDGLAAGLLVIAFGAFGVLSYIQGLMYVTAFCAMIIGGLTAFLWFNVPPAKFFMGDTGALSLGATLGVIAMMTNSLAVLPIIGFVFVIETLSAIIQLLSKRYFGRKVFRVTPLHHHFEDIGWPEYNVTMRFWIIGGALAVIGLIIGIVGMGAR